MGAGLEGEVHVWYCREAKLKSENLIAMVLANYRQWRPSCHRLVRSANRKIHVRDRTGRSPFHVNVSRSGEMAICAVSEAGLIGADIESLDRAELMEAHEDLLPQGAAGGPGQSSGVALLSNWVRLEAALKAAGVGLLEEPLPAASDQGNGGCCLHQVNGQAWRSYCATLADTHLVGVAMPARHMASRVRVIELERVI